MDLADVSTVVATVAATGAIQGLSEDSARSTVERIRRRLREAFRRDEDSTTLLIRACHEPGNEQIRLLATSVSRRMEEDSEFAAEMTRWAAEYRKVQSGQTQQITHAGRDAYISGRDLTINHGREA